RPASKFAAIRRQSADCEQGAVKIGLTKILLPDQNHSRRNIYAADENAREPNRTPTPNWRMEALCGLRGRIETSLAAASARSCSKDRPVCEGIWILPAILPQRSLRNLR